MSLAAFKKVLSSIVKEVDKKYLLPGESEETAKEAIINEIAHDVYFFDNWYFGTDPDDLDPRPDRIKGSVSSGSLFQIILNEVETGLDELREVGMLPVEPNTQVMAGELTWYVENWKDWYYESKKQYDQGDFLERRGENEEIYYNQNYGDSEISPGVSNAYDDGNIPHSPSDVEIETVVP